MQINSPASALSMTGTQSGKVTSRAVSDSGKPGNQQFPGPVNQNGLASPPISDFREKQIAEQVREMESLFISMMLKTMRQTEGGEGLFPGDKSDTFGGMFDTYMSDHLSGQGGLGLSSMLEKGIRGGGMPGSAVDVERLRADALQAYAAKGVKQE